MASTYGTRPSQVLGFQEPWISYQFDLAVYLFSTQVENLASETNTKGKRVRTLVDIMGLPNGYTRPVNTSTPQEVRAVFSGVIGPMKG